MATQTLKGAYNSPMKIHVDHSEDSIKFTESPWTDYVEKSPDELKDKQKSIEEERSLVGV
jgi:hypothetical protein